MARFCEAFPLSDVQLLLPRGCWCFSQPWCPPQPTRPRPPLPVQGTCLQQWGNTEKPALKPDLSSPRFICYVALYLYRRYTIPRSVLFGATALAFQFLKMGRENVLGDRAAIETPCFSVINGMIQLVLLWTRGHGMTLRVSATLASRPLSCPTTNGSWAWADTGAGSTQVPLLTHLEQTHFAVNTEQGGCHKPVEMWPFVLSSLSGSALEVGRRSLGPSVLRAGLWPPPVLTTLLPTGARTATSCSQK